ncbi:MAG: hypothetical protein U0K57_03825 [Lachnospiraceae bacterium]|nr:hypothetical protein [Lachnospiraceae bacterium]
MADSTETSKSRKKVGKHDHKAGSKSAGQNHGEIYQGYDLEETIENRYKRPWFWKILGISLLSSFIIIFGIVAGLYIRQNRKTNYAKSINKENTVDKLLDGHKNFEIVCKIDNKEEGSSYKTTRQISKNGDDYYSYFKKEGSDNDYKEVIDKQKLYRSDDRFTTAYGLIGDDYDSKVVGSIKNSTYRLTSRDNVSSEKTSGNLVKIVASYTVKAGDKYNEKFGLQVGDTVNKKIVMSKETRVVSSAIESFDGDQIYSYKLKFDAKKRIPRFYAKVKKIDEKRKITVYHNYGSSNQKKYTFKIPQDVYFNLLKHTGYKVYIDKKCKTAFSSYQVQTQNPETNLSLYMKRTK